MDYQRQLDLVPMEKLQRANVHLVGAGGIGSPTAIALAKMGIGRLDIWDDDRVEDHNLPNQFYAATAVGLFKAEALVSLVDAFSGKDGIAQAHCERLDNSKLDGIVISAVDSMASRKDIWLSARKWLGVSHYIEARMGGEMIIVYSLNPHDPLASEEYEKTLHSDKEALELPCTARSIIYTGLMAGSLISNAVKRHLVGETVFEVILDLTSFTLMTR